MWLGPEFVHQNGLEGNLTILRLVFSMIKKAAQLYSQLLAHCSVAHIIKITASHRPWAPELACSQKYGSTTALLVWSSTPPYNAMGSHN